MASRSKPSRASAKKAAGGALPPGSGTAAKRAGPLGGGLDVLRLGVRSLKNLVLFQKAKQKLLRSSFIGPAQVNALLADYLKVVLTLTGASAGSILLLDRDRLSFRAVCGTGSRGLLGKHIASDEGIAGWVCRNGKTCLSSDVSRDTRWSSRISAGMRFPNRNILCSPVPARITADTFGAITTDRPYRRAADWKTAVDEINRCSGREYDLLVVEAFTKARRAGDITIVPA